MSSGTSFSGAVSPVTGDTAAVGTVPEAWRTDGRVAGSEWAGGSACSAGPFGSAGREAAEYSKPTATQPHCTTKEPEPRSVPVVVEGQRPRTSPTGHMSPRPAGIQASLGSQGGISPSPCDAQLGTLRWCLPRAPGYKARSAVPDGKWVQTPVAPVTFGIQYKPLPMPLRLPMVPLLPSPRLRPPHFPSSLQPHQPLCCSSVMLGGSCLRTFAPTIPTTKDSPLPQLFSWLAPPPAQVSLFLQEPPTHCLGQGSLLFPSHIGWEPPGRLIVLPSVSPTPTMGSSTQQGLHPHWLRWKLDPMPVGRGPLLTPNPPGGEGEAAPGAAGAQEGGTAAAGGGGLKA